MDFLLDPYILAVPSTNGSQAEKYVNNLYSWTSECRRKKHKFWTSFPIVEALINAGQYPDYNYIQTYIGKNSGYIDANTLFRAIQEDITSPPFIDESYQIESFYYETVDSVVLPDEVKSRLHPGVAIALQETLIILAIAKVVQGDDLAEKLIFGSGDISDDDESIELRTSVVDVDNDETADLAAEWSIVTSTQQLDDLEGFMSFWEDTPRVIKYVYTRLFKSSMEPPTCPSTFSNPVFNVMVSKYCIDRNPTALFKLFRVTVLGLTGEKPRNKRNHHILYKDNKPVKRKDVIAWRLWIEESSPGWRLHYWKYPDGSIELANFVKHDEYYIPEPSWRS